MQRSFLFFLLFLGCCTFPSQAQQYHPQQLFTTNFYNHKGNLFRSASGKPSAHYWQNEANYQVVANFDPKDRVLKGKVDIEYTNNSPDELDFLWLQMDQNDENIDARHRQMRLSDSSKEASKGYVIDSFKIKRDGKMLEADYAVYGTRLRIDLKEPMKSQQKLNLTIDYSYVLRETGGAGRSGYMDTEEGRIYEFSYWYPRMAVYDDYYGWNTLPFIGGGEMYLDYGDIDYKVTVPSDQVVVGSGILLNAEEILNTKTLKRLQKAAQSDQVVMIRSAQELNEAVTKTETATTTWHFKMKNTRDVAWAMSTAFIWDAARINLSKGKTALAQSVYPKISTQEGRGWARSTEMLKFSTEYFSNYLMDYPYAVATSVAGTVGGMEFPGIVYNGWRSQEGLMFLLASHEIGHTWFPMIVGSDERRDAFLDEGLNVFMDIYAQEAYNHGEFAPKRDGEYAPGGGNPNDEIIAVMDKLKDGPTIMTPPDAVNSKDTHPLEYFKAAHGLVLLREVILGPEKFDFAFKQYVKRWAFKHPRPEDFFRSMENASGEDLSWFWNGWFYHNWQLDQAVEGVRYVGDNPEKGGYVELKNKQPMALPVLMKVVEENKKVHKMTIPVEIWRTGAVTEIKVHTNSRIKEVILDEDHELPDLDRSNNHWKS